MEKGIISKLDFLYERGYGRGGFVTSCKLPLYLENGVVLERFHGHYLNPLGPFKKEIQIRACVIKNCYEYTLTYKVAFWASCSEYVFSADHLTPFLRILKKYVNGDIENIDQAGYLGFSGVKQRIE